MEQLQHAIETLDLMDRPAFCVADGVIAYANHPARGRLITAGTPVSQLLYTGAEEYAAFTDGCLYLTLSIEDSAVGASVTRMGSLDIFRLEQPSVQPELRAMALAARELRGPLANMIAAADRLFPAIADKDDTAPQTAQLNRGLHQLQRLVGNMSDAARYISDNGARQEHRDICSVIDEVFEKAAALVESKGITLRFTGLRESVYSLTDTEKLERAIYNILSNSVKFTPAGGTIEAKLTRSGNRLALTVTDSGEGIGDDLRTSVWFRYQRDPALEDTRQGIGLGLVLIRSAAAAHGGTVLLQSSPTGLKLTMTLVIRQSADTTLRSPVLRVDYAGERDHGLIELSDSLPTNLYLPK